MFFFKKFFKKKKQPVDSQQTTDRQSVQSVSKIDKIGKGKSQTSRGLIKSNKLFMAWNKNAEEKKQRQKSGLVADSYLKQISPKKGFTFHSDYFEVGDGVAQILTIVPTKNADRQLPPFWVTRMLPRGLGQNVTARLIQPISTKTEKWTKDNEVKADAAVRQAYGERKVNDPSNQDIAFQVQDMHQINEDLRGGQYHGSEYKILLKAPDVETLDSAREQYKLRLKNNFRGLTVEVFEGQQKDDFENLLKSADAQIGHEKKMYTSQELAGGYYLMSKGIDDITGKYVGVSEGDFNNPAMLMDVDDWSRNIVVASKFGPRTGSYSTEVFGDHLRSISLWGVKIAEDAMIQNHRVVHFILNNTDIEDIGKRKIGADLSKHTSNINMGKGAINPFEAFGREEDKLNVYPTLTEKLRLMFKEMSPSLNDVDLNKYFTQLLKEFMEDKGLWKPNAKENIDTISLVGLPHNEYPLLSDFSLYLSTIFTIYQKQGNQQAIKSLEKIQGVVDRMKEENGDIFDKHTSSVVDNAQTIPQVIYDFASISERGRGIAMAQFINTLGYATQNLHRGDVVIIHGVDQLAPEVKEFVKDNLQKLTRRDVRIAYLYDNVMSAINDKDFNDLTSADYTLFSAMSSDELEAYKETMKATIPSALENSLISKDDLLYYLSRDREKVLFKLDLIL
ncbi:hypothetical protein [Ligilactobacillus equi]|uniref:Conjugation-related ATPase n=2 Tax=Ligilactobacillus equi TaxID=137357 RepID=A0A0R1TSV0_9LACO|nr:hypothetical protein [Ligilactobacillus equi]KRL84345.1 hypothetical protein FC36_GL000268 [Ligilactobacillus equi DSM 15833 = JCM 10991]